MRIFTLGKMRVPLLFFALFLFSGTYSYGQCPTVENQAQEFCYLSTVAELEATDTGDGVRWYRTATSTNPIPENELLQNGSYFAGNAIGTCSNRVEVSVTVINPGAPTPSFGAFFQPCEYSTSDTSTVQDLINTVDPTVDGYIIEVFAEEFSGTALASVEPLVAGSNYFVGQRDPSPNSCPSTRVAIQYSPVLALAPTGDAPQEFCEGATVADLQAEATSQSTTAFRWYSTATSNPALSPSTPLVDGETYYASQIVNRTGSTQPPCESTARFAVTVTVNSVLTEETQRFCESIGEGNNFRKPEVQDLSPAGEWYADDTFTTPLDPNTELIDGAQYYQIGSQECEVLVVTADFFPTPNAGSTTQVSFCENDLPVNLVDEINNSQLGAPDQTGFFTPALSTGTNEFDPSDYAPGSYTFTYTVQGNDDCPTDTSAITVTVTEAPNAGVDVSETVCSADLEDEEFLQQFAALMEGRDEGGTFTPTLETLYGQYLLSPIGTFSTTYSLTGDNGCQDSAALSVEVLQSPTAGESVTIYLEDRDDSVIDLLAELGNPTGGTWDTGNGFFDPTSGTTPASFTYTVTADNGCTASATVRIFAVQEDCPEVTEATQRFCASIGEGNNFRKPNVSDLEPATATWYASADSTDPLPPSTILVDGEDYFAGTTTGNCENRASVTVEIFDTPNAGGTTTVNVCSNEAEFDLVSKIGPSVLGAPQTTGYFSPALSTGTHIFNPGDYAPGSYTFKYIVEGNDDCPTDDTTVYVNVTAAPDAGESLTINLEDRDNSIIDLLAELGGDNGGTWDTGDGSFDPTSDTAGTFTYSITANGCTDSATVTVVASTTEDCPEVTEATQRFCASIGEGNNFRKPNVSDLEPATATWYASADSTDPLPSSTILVDGEDYFAGTTSGNCENRASVTVDIFDTPNAGGTTTVNVCSNEAEFDLVSRINNSLLGAPQTTGYFSPALSTGSHIFNPGDYAPGSYTFKYIVEGNDDCPTDDTTVYVNVKAVPDAGNDINENFCVADISDLISSQEEFLALYADDTRATGGTFNPSLETLVGQFATSPYGNFSTVYTVTVNGCTDTANLSVTITQEEPANAGGNVEVTLCSTDGIQSLEDLLNADAILGGTFSTPYEDGTFDPSAAGTEPVVITYTVGENDACVSGSDSATITITVIEGPDAGADGSITLDVNDNPVNLFDSLGGSPDTGGTWSPGSQNGELDPSSLQPGSYTYTYTVVGDNNCTDSAVVTVTIEGEIIECPEVTQTEQAFCESIETGNNFRLPRVSDLLPANAVWYATADSDVALPSNTVLVDGTTYFAGNVNGTCEDRDSVTVTLDDSPNAGATTQVTFCENGDPVDLLTVMNPSILGAPDAGGTFTPALASGTTLFDPAVDAAGTYTYRVESTNDVCPADTAVITISFTAAPSAGSNVELSFCVADGEQNLFDYLPDGVSDTGTFEGLPDGLFTPSETGEFTFEYSVAATGACEGTSTATYTITVEDTPDAPTVVDFDGCVVDGATVTDLDISGEAGATFEVFTDAELTEPAADTDVLVEGTYYATQTNAAGCVSEAAAITVILNDADAPTLTTGGNVFCEFDGATLADLEESVSGGGEIIWYTTATGTDPVSNPENVMLQNNTTYYATSTDATTGCESSQRLSVTVTLEDCEIMIPDAFSPNGDEVNDKFVVINLTSEYPNHKMEIYNRWGEPVFIGQAGEDQGWDGTSTEGSFGNGVLPVGVYFYILYFNDGQTAPTQGRLYLSR